MILETNYLGTIHNGVKSPKFTFYSKKIITIDFETKLNGPVLVYNPIITYSFYDTLKDVHQEVLHSKCKYELKTDGDTTTTELYSVCEDAIQKVKKLVLQMASPLYHFGMLEIPSFEDTEPALYNVLLNFKDHQSTYKANKTTNVVPMNRERIRMKRTNDMKG